MRVYYNEHDPFAAAWLRELIADGLIPDGWVDERDVQTVEPADLAGFDQCHFFAGIAGWAYALQLAGWGNRPVWTGSCPCQPFSTAGKGAGFDDPRHLWPTWFRLIRECRPPVVFGEQVASGAGLAWVDHVATDLESEGYAFGAADLPAAGVGAPHRRHRLFFVADSNGSRFARVGRGGQAGAPEHRAPRSMGHAAVDGRGARGLQEHALEQGPPRVQPHGSGPRRPWDGARPLLCGDGKLRLAPAEPGLFPLAHGIPNRVGTLRGAGNAIVAPLAAEFIRAYIEAEERLK